MPAYANDTLKTLEPIPDSNDVEVPECRMKDATATQSWVRRLIDNDTTKRSWKRSLVNGLVDGNPPYSQAKLRAANRADACNVNWGIGRAYMEAGSGAFYDLATEAHGIFAVRTSHGNPEQQDQWSNVMSEEADREANDDPLWDWNLQQSQWNMTLHGPGPYFFEDGFAPFPRAVAAGDLKVPERTRSDTAFWDACAILAWYYPPQLFEFIQNREAATKLGWRVNYTRNVIARATDIRTNNGRLYDWEWYQQEMKNNSLSYYDDTKVCFLAHVFWKEFDGRITHGIVQEETAASIPVEYLFIKIGRYASWQEAVHPMYYDRGNGGYHHSVTGLGVKMFGAMEYQNRLLCNLADKAFSPKILFKPTTAEASQKFQMQNFGDFAVLNSNWEWNQTGVAGLMNDGLAMNTEITHVMESNLSSYRQQQPMKQEGNPITARQVIYDASQKSTLTKTSYNRYYKQEDRLCAEIVRRLCNLNSPNKQAQAYQERCKKRGVPEECFGRIEKVEAVRVIGQGSAFMRKQAVDGLMPYADALPEDGRDALLQDKIAAEAGIAAVKRYFPRKAHQMGTEQQERATNQVGNMKDGIAPVITSSQNPVVFAGTFLTAASTVAEGLTKGANPAEVLMFLNLAGPAIVAHLKRFANDPTRAGAFKAMSEKWERLAQMTQKLRGVVEKMQEGQAKAKEQQQAAMTNAQLRQAETSASIAIKQQKTQAQLEQSAQKHQQKMIQGAQDRALKDAVTAADIRRENAKAANERETAEATTE